MQCSTSWGEERGSTKWRYGRKNSNQQLRSNGIAEDRAEDRARGRASKRGQARGTPMSKTGWKAGQEAEQGGRQVNKQNKVEGMARSNSVEGTAQCRAEAKYGGHRRVKGRGQGRERKCGSNAKDATRCMARLRAL